MPRVVPPLEAKPAGDSLTPSLIEAVAGFNAGVVSTLVVHPFDVLKTRIQLDPNRTTPRWGYSLSVLRRIVSEENGRVSALYRGIMPNMIGNSVSWAIFFLWYHNLKDAFQTWRGPNAALTSQDFFLASSTSGILTAILTNPIWVIKTRMIARGRSDPMSYRSMWHGCSSIWRDEGWRGFYRGLLPSLFGVSHGAIQFSIYEKLKNRRHLTSLDYVLLSAASKVTAGGITYPYQVFRSRLQQVGAERLYSSASDALVKVWKEEGIRGYYRGLVPNLVRVLPSTCVTFLTYEQTRHYLPKMVNKQKAEDY